MTSPQMTSMVSDRSIDTLAGLNEAQHEAVLHFEGPLLVLAGAGSGKTRVLTRRIARLIEHHGVDPSRLLAVTFTNKAAQEMRGRVSRLLGEEPSGMWIGTFHAIGARILRREAPLIGRTNAFTIYDEEQSLAVVKRVMDRLRISTKTWSPKAMRAAISDAKNALVSVDEYTSLALDPMSRAAAQVYEHLEAALRDANAVDFDDLLVHPVRIFQRHADRLARYREKFQFILVDEYQDTNRAQYQLIVLLGAEHGNVCVVGDDDQSIYGWRGADIRNILDFEKDFPAAHVVRLEENYRSTPEVLELANVVIRGNTSRRGKTLRATRPEGERVTVVGCLDERDEAEWVADEITGRQSVGRATSLRDIAVLYRTNAQSRALEESLRRRGMPYRLIGAVRFYDRREIRDLMSYLRLIANPADDDAFLRAVSVPKRGLGDTTLDALAAIAREAKLPLLATAGRADLLARLRPAARQALADFAALILNFRERAVDAAVDELLRALIDEIHYVDVLRAEGPESTERIDNVRELVVGAAEQVMDARSLSPACVAHHRRGSAGHRRRRGDDDDAAQRQGAGVPGGLHHRTGGGTLSAEPRARRAGAAGGGAAAVLRRDHARRAEALSHSRAKPAPERRDHAIHSVELPPADPAGDARPAGDHPPSRHGAAGAPRGHVGLGAASGLAGARHARNRSRRRGLAGCTALREGRAREPRPLRRGHGDGALGRRTGDEGHRRLRRRGHRP
jgi:DNA helicase-2/ATP-dependent DNA helicase PcrA